MLMRTYGSNFAYCLTLDRTAKMKLLMRIVFDLSMAAPQEGWVLRPPPRPVEAVGGAPNHEDVPVVVLDEAGAAELALHGPNNEPVPNAPQAEPAPDAPQAEPAPDAPQAEPAPDVHNNEPAPDAMHAAQAPDAPLAEPPYHGPQGFVAHDTSQAEPVPDDAGPPKQVLYLSDSSSESSSMWRALHEYYGSDSDADSVFSPTKCATVEEGKVFTSFPC
ncbi:hypothetical protein Salat_0177300 [Sesamum alatum]|uniref:Uncharacterized protein n=1 Tax=Sesamum alatum TaxID=300844 RepID=A0AAE1YXH0_9LAMI|nr:hypothetical protein Salat_0177300 [Sesamum alatum]